MKYYELEVPIKATINGCSNDTGKKAVITAVNIPRRGVVTTGTLVRCNILRKNGTVHRKDETKHISCFVDSDKVIESIREEI